MLALVLVLKNLHLLLLDLPFQHSNHGFFIDLLELHLLFELLEVDSYQGVVLLLGVAVQLFHQCFLILFNLLVEGQWVDDLLALLVDCDFSGEA